MSDYFSESRFVSRDMKKHIIVFTPSWAGETVKFVGDHMIKQRISTPQGTQEVPCPVQFDIVAKTLEEAFEKYTDELVKFVENVNAKQNVIQAASANVMDKLKFPGRQ
jgi:hypothetical protein